MDESDTAFSQPFFSQHFCIRGSNEHLFSVAIRLVFDNWIVRTGLELLVGRVWLNKC